MHGVHCETNQQPQGAYLQHISGMASPGIDVSVLHSAMFMPSCTMASPLPSAMHVGITHHYSAVMTQSKIIGAAMPSRKCVENAFFVAEA